ncbi:MAG TPA: DUF1735 domain-containing protein [Flavisolibacter sp.]|jgi:hypothetical protein|nr:DUF1735 domain-containing protein [Flavisolibacter sp.]
MKKSLLLPFLISPLLLIVSCKRSDVFGGIEPNTSRVMAEFTDARTGTFVTGEYSAQPTAVALTELRLEPRTITNHTTTVKIILNPVVVSAYNAANGTDYHLPPAGTFSLSPETYSLNPEQRKVVIKGQMLPSALVDAQYAVGLSIAEMSDGYISKLAHDVIVFISIKNSYDGIYSVKGYSNVPGTAFTGNFFVPCGEDLALATSGSSSVIIDPGQPVYSGGIFTYVSNLLPNIVFDKATNKVTGVLPRPGSIDFIFPFDAAYNSRYDPALKTVYIKYGIAPVGSGRYVVDTLTFCKQR